MNIELKKWTFEDKESLISICNRVERRYLTNRMPYPYTEKDADWWLSMIYEQEGKDGVFRSITVDGRIVGNISVKRKADVYGKDAELGYLLMKENWSKGDYDTGGEADL